MQTSSGIHPASRPIVTEVKWLEFDADHLLLSNVEVKKAWSIISTFPLSSGHGA